jgi:predicted enzyme related to lactoylglutathione lyase
MVGLSAAWLLAGSTLQAVDSVPSVPPVAGVSFNSARLGATHPEALAKFYEALGLKEVNRLTFPGVIEIMMNFGATVEEAKQNPGPQLVIMTAKHVDRKDTVPHLIFNMTDVPATVATLKAARAKVIHGPEEFGNTGIVVIMAIDPAGNHIELLKMPKK